MGKFHLKITMNSIESILFHRFLYIVDSNNHRVVRWTRNYTAGGECIVGCTGSYGTQANRLYFPRDLKFDASGNLFVNDQRNNRIQKFMLVLLPNCSASMYIHNIQIDVFNY